MIKLEPTDDDGHEVITVRYALSLQFAKVIIDVSDLYSREETQLDALTDCNLSADLKTF